MKFQDAFYKRIYIFLFAGILIAIVICVSLFYFLKSRSLPSNISKKKETTAPIAHPVNPALVEQYKKSVKEKVVLYNSVATAQEVRDYLVAITVPSSEYKDIHLDLVILFDKLDLAERNNNENEKNKLIARLEDLKNKNSWLR